MSAKTSGIKMKFSKLAKIFNEIDLISGRLLITEKLSALFTETSADEAQAIAYLVLGQLNPPYIGTQFNLAKKSVLKVVARLLGKSNEEVAAELKEVGDLGTIVSSCDREPGGDLSVLEVYDILQKLEALSGTGSQEAKQDALCALLYLVDSLGAKYITRIILGTLRLGFSDMTVIDALSWMLVGNKSVRKDIEHAYNLSADIGKVAFVAKEFGVGGIKNTSIVIGIPIRPAAAERAVNSSAVIDKIGTCVAQPKLDGFRLQIHVKKVGSGTVVKFFSRNLLDMSDMFPDLVESFASLGVDSLICEGEAIVYDENTGEFAPFQETVKRRRKHGIDQAAEELPLKLIVFDVLYLNGAELLSKTHVQRRRVLIDLFGLDQSKKVTGIEEEEISEADQLELYFMNKVALGLEGLVVKKPDSVYQPGKRNFNWIKLKRKEDGQLDDTIDCVILGYYAGQGRRASFGIGAFLVAVYNIHKDHFQTVAKIGTGLKDDQWIALKEKCDAIKIDDKPKNVDCAKSLYPDVWVAPKMVCTVRADDITKSPLHTANKTQENPGIALRFPRIMGYRVDKSATDATGVDELKELYEMQFKK
jgi:DNA ligase-1